MGLRVKPDDASLNRADFIPGALYLGQGRLPTQPAILWPESSTEAPCTYSSLVVYSYLYS
jgi:hypothetical protein